MYPGGRLKTLNAEGQNTKAMNYYLSTKKILCLIILGFLTCALLPGCKSPQEYKEDSDKKVYNVLDEKWNPDFGSKANYKIGDTQPSADDIDVEKAIPSSGILTLPQAIAIATEYNRDYQTERELLYVTALDLILIRHDFEPQFFAKSTGGYAKANNSELIGTATGFDA